MNVSGGCSIQMRQALWFATVPPEPSWGHISSLAHGDNGVCDMDFPVFLLLESHVFPVVFMAHLPLCHHLFLPWLHSYWPSRCVSSQCAPVPCSFSVFALSGMLFTLVTTALLFFLLQAQRLPSYSWGKEAPWGLPWRLSGKEPTCQCRRHRFSPWSGKIPSGPEQWSLYATTVEPVL